MKGKGGDLRYFVGASCPRPPINIPDFVSCNPVTTFTFLSTVCLVAGPLYFGLFWPLLGPGWAQPTNLCAPCLALPRG